MCALAGAAVLSACGKTKNDQVRYELVNGQVVIAGEESQPEEEIFPEAGTFDTSQINEGTAYVKEAYNSQASDVNGVLAKLKEDLGKAADACREAYISAYKGEAVNVSLSDEGMASMLNAIGEAGYSACDSLGEFDMRAYSAMDSFGRRISTEEGNISGTYFVVYRDGHLSGFTLARESGVWHIYSASAAWNDDCSYRVYSEGRYAVGKAEYTEKGWLIYSRDTSDFDENQKANTDSYIMIKVLPADPEARALCKKYVECVGYFENNLFTTDWSEANMVPIDFNSLYAYVFALYNGTDMLSSYNVRTYYKAVAGTRLYLVPEDIFENNTGVYFNIGKSTLRAISDYSSQLGGYFFLGYNTDYFNVTPRTPFPEVVAYEYNSNGTITLTVDAVNKWYGTDRAFRHILTVRPEGNAFKFVSNTLVQDEANIIPAQKLSVMLDVERTKTDY